VAQHSNGIVELEKKKANIIPMLGVLHWRMEVGMHMINSWTGKEKMRFD
jgi:hypothetical protein